MTGMLLSIRFFFLKNKTLKINNDRCDTGYDMQVVSIRQRIDYF